MLRRLGIRAKVLAVLAVPMLVVLLAGAYISWQTIQNLSSAQNVRRVVAAVAFLAGHSRGTCHDYFQRCQRATWLGHPDG